KHGSSGITNKERLPTMKGPKSSRLSILALLALALTLCPSASTRAQSTSRTFPETDKTLSGRFLDYWRTHGGLAQQGYPISDEFLEKSSLDGNTYLVQYFERTVFELHPENADTPYEVLLSQLGAFRYSAAYNPNGTPKPPVGSLTFRGN